MEYLYKQFEEGKYKINILNKDIPIPKKPIDIKNIIYYYIMFLGHKLIKNDYFDTTADFVCIPNNEIIIKDMNELIDFVSYIKYKMKSHEIILNSKKIIN